MCVFKKTHAKIGQKSILFVIREGIMICLSSLSQAIVFYYKCFIVINEH